MRWVILQWQKHLPPAGKSESSYNTQKAPSSLSLPPVAVTFTLQMLTRSPQKGPLCTGPDQGN